MKYFRFRDLDKRHKKNRYFLTLEDNTYSFVVEWVDYCNSAFLSIYDYYNNPIVMGKALTNGLIIRNKKLPSLFIFSHLFGKTYEPNIDIISSEFGLFYGKFDEEE